MVKTNLEYGICSLHWNSDDCDIVTTLSPICSYATGIKHLNKIKRFFREHSEEFVPPLIKRDNFKKNLSDICRFGGVIYCSTTEPRERILGAVTFIHLNESKTIENKFTHIPYIATSEQYKRTGLMNILMTQTIDYEKKHGTEKIFLETWSTNIASRSLFDKLGFTEIKIKKNARGRGIDEIQYELIL